MKILHTSDWHIGRMLYTKRRDKETDAFLEWLLRTIDERDVEALIIAGDVFDTAAPSADSQGRYYRFLGDLQDTCCRAVVVIAGNHDSAALIDAPRPVLEMLKDLEVHAVGSAAETEREIVILRGKTGEPELAVCAVPFLRESDLRAESTSADFADRQRAFLDALKGHYAHVFDEARKLKLPIAATGHLFAAGGRCSDDDGVRELYVGTLVRADADIFPDDIAYTALGHLHVPQTVGGRDNVRYSGSPIPMGFGEAGQQKIVCIADITPEGTRVEEVPIPSFRRLEMIRGTASDIERRLREIRAECECGGAQLALGFEESHFVDDEIWVEVQCTDASQRNIADIVNDAIKGSPIKLIHSRIIAQDAAALAFDDDAPISLTQLRPDEVFARRLDGEKLTDDERARLTEMYGEVLAQLREEGRIA